ncbi:MAG: hypothetical protein AAB897_00920 [Patescibacteria group bacterium]
MKTADKVELLGAASGVITTASFVPQVVKIWWAYPAPANDISLLAFAALTFGVAGWIAYGVFRRSPSLIIANSLTFVFAGSILVYKLICG